MHPAANAEPLSIPARPKMSASGDEENRQEVLEPEALRSVVFSRMQSSLAVVRLEASLAAMRHSRRTGWKAAQVANLFPENRLRRAPKVPATRHPTTIHRQ